MSFDVEVDDTAAANLCNLFGPYRLVLTNEHVTLLDTSDCPVLSWQYRSTIIHTLRLLSKRLILRLYVLFTFIFITVVVCADYTKYNMVYCVSQQLKTT